MTEIAKETMRQSILRDIDRATAPERMSQPEALGFLEELAGDLDARTEALKHEMEEDWED